MRPFPFFVALVSLSAFAGPLTPEGFEYKTFVGYQAWFHTPNDGTNRGWHHWSIGSPSPSSMTVDMWPDVSEYPAGTLENTGLITQASTPLLAYGASHQAVIDTHFRWMREYDIAGAFLQWFVADEWDRQLVAGRVRSAAEANGRTFVLMFDISGTKNAASCGTGPALLECLKTRWKWAVDSGLTSSSAYQRFKGLPLVAVWGMGFTTQDHFTWSAAQGFITWVHTTVETKYRATIMGGVPEGWRTLTDSAIRDANWNQVYAALDIVSPWSGNRYQDDDSARAYIRGRVGSDLVVIRQRNQRYLPVIFPGFSDHNLQVQYGRNTPFNFAKRWGGQFLYTQARENAQLGLTSFYEAMFDEVDEGTAMYKLAPGNQVAASFANVGLNADGYTLPSDWYLQMNRLVLNQLRQPGYSGYLTSTVPGSVKAGSMTLPAGSVRDFTTFKLAFQTDGNLVIYRQNNQPVWATGTVGRNCTPTTCAAVFQTDGNFLLTQNGVVFWASNGIAPNGTMVISTSQPFIQILATDGTIVFTTSSVLSTPYSTFNLRAGSCSYFTGGQLCYQHDGNLVAYDAAFTPTWASNTSGRSCTASSCLATYQTDGNFVLYQNGAAYWAAGTQGFTTLNVSSEGLWFSTGNW